MHFNISKWILFIWDQFWFLITLRPRDVRLPPSYPGRVPLLGNVHELFGDSRNFWRQLKKWSNNSLKQGGLALLHLGPKNFFIISDPEDALTLSNNHFDKPYIYDFGKFWLTDGLITATGAVWKPSRKAIAPAFSANMLHDFMPILNETAKKFVDRMSENINKGYFDPWNYVVKSLLENICQTIFGLQSTEDELITEYSDGALTLIESLCKRFFQFWLHVPFIYNYSFLKRKIDRLCKSVIGLVNEIISKRKLLRQNIKNSPDVVHAERFTSLLDYLLDTNEKRKIFMDDDIRAHLDTMTVAAFDTTASAMIFVLSFIGTYPEVQNRIQKELTEIFENSSRDVDKLDLAKMVYMEAVIKESIRLYPPVPLILRSSDKEVKLKNYTLPAHGVYGISIYGVNRNPMWGEDAEEFRPERWLEPESLPENPNAFCSFSLGKRNCIGKYYAMMFMKVTLAHLFRRYRVTSDISKADFKWDITLKSLTGHEITIEELKC